MTAWVTCPGGRLQETGGPAQRIRGNQLASGGPASQTFSYFSRKPLCRATRGAYSRSMTYSSWLAPKRDRRHSCPLFAQPGTGRETGWPPC